MLRNDSGIEEQNFGWYNDHILMPFIEGLRNKLGHHEQAPITKDLTAVKWNDRGIPRLAANMTESRQARNSAQLILECKHAASASGSQQPADLSPLFRGVKCMCKTVVPDSRMMDTGLRQPVRNELRRCERDFNVKLPEKKEDSLLDFITSLPEILSSSARKKSIIQGFVASGMIDKVTETTPDFFGILNTMKRYREKWETGLVIETFPRLF